MSLFGKDQGEQQSKADFDGSGQLFFQEGNSFYGEAGHAGLRQGGFGFGGGLGSGGLSQSQSGLGLPQSTSLGNLAAGATAAGVNQPLFNRGAPVGLSAIGSANPAGLRPGLAGAPPSIQSAPPGGLGGILGLGANSATSTPGRGQLPPSLAQSASLGGTPAGLGGNSNQLRSLLNLTPGGGAGIGAVGAGVGEEEFGSSLGGLELEEGGGVFGGDLLGGGSRPTPSLFPSMTSTPGSASGSIAGLNIGSLSLGGSSSLSLPGSQAAGQGGDSLVGGLSSLSIGGAPSAATPPAGFNKYGLLAYAQETLRADKESQQLSGGIDLTSFGLNLAAQEMLFPSFTSPFTENMFDDSKPYKLPACYPSTPVPFKIEFLPKLALETLFYIFYYLPRDLLQTLAALELYRREWRYHGELKVWLKPRTAQEMLSMHPNVQFVYFDPKSFEVRFFNAAGRGNVAAGILPDEAIRMTVNAQMLAAVTAPQPAPAAVGSGSLLGSSEALGTAPGLGSGPLGGPNS